MCDQSIEIVYRELATAVLDRYFNPAEKKSKQKEGRKFADSLIWHNNSSPQAADPHSLPTECNAMQLHPSVVRCLEG